MSINENNSAIVTLTRGYNNLQSYNKLILRNKSIEKNLYNKNIVLIIFHEGNILEEHQKYINSNTNSLSFEYIDVAKDGLAFHKEKEKIEKYNHHEVYGFPAGYFHMCHFWSIDFFYFVKNFDYIIRIDEDCTIDFNVDEMFNKLQHTTVLYGNTFKDVASVTQGLNQFTIDFLKKNIKDKNFRPRPSVGPYTNIILFNLKRIRENDLIFEFLEEIKNSNNIYRYRWGDLPIWGEILHYFVDIDVINNSNKTIKYYHSSHSKQIN